MWLKFKSIYQPLKSFFCSLISSFDADDEEPFQTMSEDFIGVNKGWADDDSSLTFYSAVTKE